ncbi:hypothetical protein I302_100222 [Kwoniella bestiolae CBS 10118]|uniref:J domain-containing protein n=1 Tax=Kwoniella bestiolae CBS 10118 TaxID=1296100 RepID=A0A1B9G4J9_9TREE|nr:hypothetical protein I302_03596 [Kwoniella bestiolae CBS 10118]OCF25920.1 hypothetical protein I302_03596 [Kwoniella bestiolae CBS 10118]
MAPVLSEEEAALDPYAILEVNSDATDKDIQRSYRKKSLKCHPDRNPSPEAAIQFRQISVSLEILLNPNKRTYVDTKLENDRKKRERYAEMDKKRKDMVDALNAREEEAKRFKSNQQERRKQEAEEEAIKDAGRRLLEEAQKRAMAAASAAAKPPQPPVSPTSTPSSTNPNPNSQPDITPTDLTLILTFPPSSSSSSSSEMLQSTLQTKYGPIAHLMLTDPPANKKKKGKKAVVEFQKGNWGGCWACWKDSETGKGVEEGIKVKWAGGDVPSWVGWAERQRRAQTNEHTNDKENGHSGVNTQPNGHTVPLPGSFNSAPSFGSAPDFSTNGGTTMSDLLSAHARTKEEKRKNDHFESMTLLRMRQLERERMEAKIREEEGEE